MSKAKLAITLEEDALAKIDRLVERHVFPNRSRVIQEAVTEKLARFEKGRLALECAKLNRVCGHEQALAATRNTLPKHFYRWRLR